MSQATALRFWSTDTPNHRAWDTTNEVQPTIWKNGLEELKQSTTKTRRRHLESEIEAAAKRLLTLDDDWDGEGSPGYTARAFDRATKFLRIQIGWMWEVHSVEVPAPQINPGPNGSIDIHWKQPSWELLVNIPREEGQWATFYGDDYGAGIIKGSIDTTKPSPGLVTWLMK